jgi:transposase
MRGSEKKQESLFSYISLEQRIPQSHPLRDIREMVDHALDNMHDVFSELYSHTGRPSVPPEYLLRASLLQVLYSIRSERQLMEQLDFNLLFRWFVGLSIDDAVWNHSVFSKNRDRLLTTEMASFFFCSIHDLAIEKDLISTSALTVHS